MYPNIPNCKAGVRPTFIIGIIGIKELYAQRLVLRPYHSFIMAIIVAITNISQIFL